MSQARSDMRGRIIRLIGTVGFLIVWFVLVVWVTARSRSVSDLPASSPPPELTPVITKTDTEAVATTELLTFMDVVTQSEAAADPYLKERISRCYGEWCEIAGWEFKSNAVPNVGGVSPLFDVMAVKVFWPDGRETSLDKDVNLSAVDPAPPALLTYRFVRYGTYEGQLPPGDYRFQFTFADGRVGERSVTYAGEIIHIPHDFQLNWDGTTLVISWQQDQPTALLDRYEVLVYPEDQLFPNTIEPIDVLEQVRSSGFDGPIQVELTGLNLQRGTTYIVELSAKAGVAHTGTGQRLKLKT